MHQSTPKLPTITLQGSIVYEAIDLFVSALYQESFISYVQMETLLVNGDDYEADFKFLEVSSYREDGGFSRHNLIL